MDKLYRILRSVESYSDEVLESLSASLGLLEEIQEIETRQDEIGCERYVAQVLPTNCWGWLQLCVSQEQLEYLLNMGFSCPRIAN